ncbi:MAG: polysaccharide biosynthesis C-terminal domain-containing protein [Candidatus Baltobacteraceae bacterium]
MHLFKQWPAYAAGRLLPAAVGFGGIALYTRMVDPASFGTYALLLSTAFLVGLIGYSWLRVASLRMMASVAPADEANVGATIALAFAAVSLVVGAVIVLGLRVYNPGLGWTTTSLTAACAIASGWFELNVSIAQARLRVGAYGMLQTGRAFGALLCSLALIAAGFKANALLGGFAVGNCAAFGAFGLWKGTSRGHFSRTLLARFFLFGWPSSIASLSYVSNTFQRFALEAIGGSAIVGIFAAASDFSQQTVGLLIGTATLAGQPLAFRARDLGSKEQLAEQLRNNARLVFAIGLPAAVGLIVLAGPISEIYLGARFHVHSGTVIAIGAAVMFLSGLRGSYFEQIFEIALKTRAVAANTVVRVVLTIAFSLWLIRPYGAIGAALAMLLAEVVGLALSVVWARRLMHTPIPWKSWFKVIAATATMVAAIAVVPVRSTFLGLFVSFAVGAVAYGAAVALAHPRSLRTYLGSFVPAKRARQT